MLGLVHKFYLVSQLTNCSVHLLLHIFLSAPHIDIKYGQLAIKAIPKFKFWKQECATCTNLNVQLIRSLGGLVGLIGD